MHSPSWPANKFAASQEIPRISRNQKVHYRTHKRPPTVSILGQLNPVHISTSHLLEICPNIIHPFTYLLTYSMVQSPSGLQLVKKFPAFHGTRKFITALTRVRQLSLSWASPIQSIYPPHLLQIHPNIILPSTPRSPQWSFSLRFPHQDPILPPLLNLISSLFVFCVMPPLETFPPSSPRRSEWGSSLPPDCFVCRGNILHVSVS